MLMAWLGIVGAWGMRSRWKRHDPHCPIQHQDGHESAGADLTVTGLAQALPYSWAEQEQRIGLRQNRVAE
jgi:hypothetical protein